MNAITAIEAAPQASAGPNEAPATRRHSWLRVVGLAWLAIFGGFILMNLGGIANLEFHDPDDELRLVQVRDLIAGQNWFDLRQHRIDAAAGGVPMHWSRLVDVPIAASILVLRPFVGTQNAELATLIIIPGITLFAMLALVGWMATRSLEPGARFLALLAVSFAAPAMVQVMPLRIDHHGWQIVMALIAVASFLDDNARRGGLLAGAALATWMAISFEGLPFSAWFIAVLACWSLVDLSMRARLVATMQSLAASSAALFLVTRGVSDLTVHCDTIAPIHLAMFAWGALAITAPTLLWPQSRMALAGGFAAASIGALALVASLAPQCTSGSFDMIDPVVRNFWYDRVMEGKPLWETEWHLMAQYLIPPLVGLWSAIALARRAEGPLRRWWIFYALVLCGAIVLSLAVARSSAISGALGALPLGWRLATWIRGLKRPSNPLLRVGELVGVAALVYCTVFPVVPILWMNKLLGERLADDAADIEPACTVRKASQAFARLPAGDILAPLDFGPNVLLNSNKGVLATGHHRGAVAMRQVIDAFTGSPDDSRAIMKRNRLRFVMICPKSQEIGNYREYAPDGLAARLMQGTAPGWLRPVPMPRASGVKLWELAE